MKENRALAGNKNYNKSFNKNHTDHKNQKSKPILLFSLTILVFFSFHAFAVPLGQPTPSTSSTPSTPSGSDSAEQAKGNGAIGSSDETIAEKPTEPASNPGEAGADSKKIEVAEQDEKGAVEVPDKDKVLRAQFTTAVVDREPTDDVVMLTNNNTNELFFFTELSNLKGESVTHRWEFEGQTMAEIKFDVKGTRWRTFSSKKIKPEWIGLWSVIVIDEDGQPLNISSVEIITETDAN